MANPQTEKGHIRIANDLFEALCRTPLTGRQRRIFDAILRETWGRKGDGDGKEDAVTQRRIGELTGVTQRSHITEETTTLARCGMIRKVSVWGKPTTYSIVKDYDQWTITPEGSTPTEGSTPVSGPGSTPTEGNGSTPAQGNSSGPDTLLEESNKSNSACASASLPLVLKTYIETFTYGRSPRHYELSDAAKWAEQTDGWNDTIAAGAIAAWSRDRWEAYRERNPDKPVPAFRYFEPIIREALSPEPQPGRNGQKPTAEADPPRIRYSHEIPDEEKWYSEPGTPEEIARAKEDAAKAEAEGISLHEYYRRRLGRRDG